MNAKRLDLQYHDQHLHLIAKCKLGDQQAYQELYRLYSKAMFNIAIKMLNDEAEAADILQEAFLDAFTRIGEFRQEISFGLWIKQIIINRSINKLRKRKIHIIPIEETHAEEITDVEEYDEDELNEQVKQIRDAIRMLPDGYRIVLTLHLLEGYDHEEIAHILSISESTSRSQFARARKKLQELLKAQ